MTDIYARIAKQAGLGKADVDAKVDALMKSFPNGDGGSLLTPAGALLSFCDKLGIKTVDIEPKAEKVLEPVMKNGAPELCQYCGSKKSWGVTIKTQKGKNAPGHITADGKPLITVVKGTTFTAECPYWIPGSGFKAANTNPAIPAAATPTSEPFFVKPPAKSDDDLLAELLVGSAPAPTGQALLDAEAEKYLAKTAARQEVAKNFIETAKKVIDAGKVPATTPNESGNDGRAAAVGVASKVRVLPATTVPTPSPGKVEAAPKVYPFVVEPSTDGAIVQYEFEAFTSPSNVYCRGHAGLEIVDNARAANAALDQHMAKLAQPATPNVPSPHDGNVSVAPENQLTTTFVPCVKIDLEGLLLGINNKLGTIGTIIAGFKTIIEINQEFLVKELQKERDCIAILEKRLAATEGIAIGANGNTQDLNARVIDLKARLDALEMAETLVKDDAMPSKPARKRAPAKKPVDVPGEKATKEGE